MTLNLDLVRARLSGVKLVGFEACGASAVKQSDAKLGGPKIAAKAERRSKTVAAKLGVNKILGSHPQLTKAVAAKLSIKKR